MKAMKYASKLKPFITVLLASYKIIYFQKICSSTKGLFMHLAS